MSISHECDVLAAQIVACDALIGHAHKHSIEHVKAQHPDISSLQRALELRISGRLNAAPTTTQHAVRVLPSAAWRDALGFDTFVEASVLAPLLLQRYAVVFRYQREVHVLVVPLPFNATDLAVAVWHSVSSQPGEALKVTTIHDIQHDGFLRASIAMASIMRRNGRENELLASETKEVLAVLHVEANGDAVLPTDAQRLPNSTVISNPTTHGAGPLPTTSSSAAKMPTAVPAVAVAPPAGPPGITSLSGAPLDALAYVLLASIEEEAVLEEARVIECLSAWRDAVDCAEELMTTTVLPRPQGNTAKPLTAILDDAYATSFPIVIAVTRAGYLENLPAALTVLVAFNGTSIVVLEPWPSRGAPRLGVFDAATPQVVVNEFAAGQRTLAAQRQFVAVRTYRNAVAASEAEVAVPAKAAPCRDAVSDTPGNGNKLVAATAVHVDPTSPSMSEQRSPLRAQSVDRASDASTDDSSPRKLSATDQQRETNDLMLDELMRLEEDAVLLRIQLGKLKEEKELVDVAKATERETQELLQEQSDLLNQIAAVEMEEQELDRRDDDITRQLRTNEVALRNLELQRVTLERSVGANQVTLDATTARVAAAVKASTDPRPPQSKTVKSDVKAPRKAQPTKGWHGANEAPPAQPRPAPTPAPRAPQPNRPAVQTDIERKAAELGMTTTEYEMLFDAQMALELQQQEDA